jgi:hypothetical protein
MATNLREAPPLPEMPEFENVRPMPQQGRGPVAMQGGYGGGGGVTQISMGRQLRRLMGMLAGGGLALAAFLIFWQSVAAPGKGPFELLAYAEAKFETGVFNGKMGVAPDGVQMTEAEYREKLAEAERNGAAKAEYALQEKIARLQADQQRIVAAYQALYQRANMIAQAALGMEAQLQAAKTQAVAGASAGNQIIATYGDIFCALGAGNGACAAADQAREKIKADLDNTRTGEVGQRINALMAEVRDPAQLVANSDLATNGVPALPSSGIGQ